MTKVFRLIRECEATGERWKLYEVFTAPNTKIVYWEKDGFPMVDEE